MENKLDLSHELGIADMKKVSLERACDLAHAQASSVLLFTMQWKDLEEHLDGIMTRVREKGDEVDGKSKLIAERERVVEVKESELGFVRKCIEEGRVEIEERENCLRSIRMEIEKRRVELEGLERCKEVELKKFLREKEGFGKEIRVCVKEVEMKRKELSEIDRLIVVRREELGMEVASYKTLIQEFKEELANKEKYFGEIDKIAREELENKKKELENKKKELKLIEENLVEVKSLENVARHSLEDVERELKLMKKKEDKYSADINWIEEEYQALCLRNNYQTQELSMKLKQLTTTEESLNKRVKELVLKEEQIEKCVEELALKRNLLSKAERSYEEIMSEHLGKELELDLVKSMKTQYLEEIDNKAKHFNLDKESLTKLQRDFKEKEARFQERVKEYEFKEKESQKTIEELCQKVEMQDKQLFSLHHLQVKIEQPDGSELNEGFGVRRSDLKACSMGDGGKLQRLMSEAMRKYDSFLCDVSNAICKAHDTAKLILDAMQGFITANTQDKGGKFRAVERSCILLLERLLINPSEISPQTRNEALELARQWKAEMPLDDPMKVTGFMHLVAGFGLASDFDGDEMKNLLNLIDPYKQNSALIHALGVAEESSVAVGQVAPSEVKIKRQEDIPDCRTDNAPENRIDLNTTEEERNVNENDSLPVVSAAQSNVNEKDSLPADVSAPQSNVNENDSLPGHVSAARNENDSQHVDVSAARNNVNGNDSLPVGVSAALLVLQHPAKFVLDVIQNSYYQNQESLGMEESVTRIYISLLERLKDVTSTIAPQVKLQASKLAVEWKNKLGVVTENSLAVLAFLQLLVAFELESLFSKDELFRLLFAVEQFRQAPVLFKSLGFANLVLDIVQNLLKKENFLQAVHFICAFNLEEEISLEAIFRTYLVYLRAKAADMFKNATSLEEKEKAADYEASSLRELVLCLKEFKLGSLIPIEVIESQLVRLETQKLLDFVSSTTNEEPYFRSMLLSQQEDQNLIPNANPSRTLSCSALLSQSQAQANQPALQAMFNPQHGDSSHSVTTSSSQNQVKHQVKNQVKVQDYRKRPRTDPHPTQISPAGFQGGQYWRTPSVLSYRQQGLPPPSDRYNECFRGWNRVAVNPPRGTVDWDVRFQYQTRKMN